MTAPQVTDLKPEDLVKLREIAEKAPGQDGWGLFAKGATLSISRNGAAPSQSIDMVHWSGFDGSSLRVKADRKALAKHIATFDPPTVLSLLADRARMEKALRDLIECDDDARNPLQNGIGLIDCIDNVGRFYQSHHLDERLKAARQALGVFQ